MIVSLLGYMGSGKSHISRIVAKKLQIKLIDLDTEITKRAGMGIPEIFKKGGELAFRKLEKETLDLILTSKENIVLSLGGGTPVYYDNMEQICSHSRSFYLRAKIGTLHNRLIKQKESRPLISRIPDEDLPEFVAKHLFERSDFYNRAEFILDTDHKTPEQLAEEIIQKLHHH